MKDAADGGAERPKLMLPGSWPAPPPGRVVPIGRHGRPRAEIRKIQQDRMLNAFVAMVGRVGLAKSYVNDVCSDARVSTKEFYDVFLDKNDCFIAALDLGARLVYEQGALAYEQTEGPWEDRLGAALGTVFTLLAANPAFARLCILETQEAGPIADDRLARIIRKYRDSFGGGAAPERPAAIPRDRLEQILIGSAFRPITEYVRQGRTEQLPALVPGLMYFLTLTTVGPERAVRQLKLARG